METTIGVYIYKLDLNVEKPVIEKFPAEVRDNEYGYTEVIRWIGPNDYSVWYSEFDTCMLGVVNEPRPNIVELIAKRDDTTSDQAAMKIQRYCCVKASHFRKMLDMFNQGLGAATEFYFMGGRSDELKQN